MSKKQFISQIINSFEENAPHIPQELEQKFTKIKEVLNDMSDREVELEGITAVTKPAFEQEIAPEKLSYLLYDAYRDMEKIATSENQFELLQVTNELRGELGLATDPPFPE